MSLPKSKNYSPNTWVCPKCLKGFKTPFSFYEHMPIETVKEKYEELLRKI